MISLRKIIFIIIATILFLNLTKVKSKTSNVIYLDAGHGGFDGGTYFEKYYEKDITLSIVKYLKGYYENLGYEVIISRDGDYALGETKKEDITKRVKEIEASNCLFYLSIHVNASPMKSLYGGQIFYNEGKEENIELSNALQKSFCTMTNTYRKAQKINDIYLVDHTERIGALVEVGFLSNEVERKLLLSEIYQEKIAYVIYMGTLDYINEKIKRF